MQIIDISILKSLENPRELRVIHDMKAPTLCRIIDGHGNPASTKVFSSRLQAERELYYLLTQKQETKKDRVDGK